MPLICVTKFTVKCELLSTDARVLVAVNSFQYGAAQSFKVNGSYVIGFNSI